MYTAPKPPPVTPVPPTNFVHLTSPPAQAPKGAGSASVLVSPSHIQLMTPQELAYKKALKTITEGDIATLEKMRKEGELALIINEVDEHGNTLLMNAIAREAIEVIRVLLSVSDVDLWHCNKAGQRAIDMICGAYLGGACPQMQEFYDLLYADCMCKSAEEGNKDGYLTDNLPSFKLTDVSFIEGDNILHAAAKTGQADIIKLVCTHATPEQLEELLATKNKAGETPLDTLFAYFFNGNYFIHDDATRKRFVESVILLINAGAKLNTYTFKTIREDLNFKRDRVCTNAPLAHLGDLSLDHLPKAMAVDYLKHNENARKKLDIAHEIATGVAGDRLPSKIKAHIAEMKSIVDSFKSTPPVAVAFAAGVGGVAALSVTAAPAPV